MQGIAQHTPIVESQIWPDETATARAAAVLAHHDVTRDALVTLHGDLGAGKTTLVRHLLRALGWRERVRSPTYTLVETYTLTDRMVWHCDLYRLHHAHEAADAGLGELLCSPGLKLIEWPERAAGWLPQPDLHIDLSVLDTERRAVTFRSGSSRGDALLVALRARRPSAD